MSTATETAARTAAVIEIELNQVIGRRDELQAMRGGITGRLAGLQSGFIEGAESLDALQSEQAKLDALDPSIGALEAKHGGLRRELAAAVNLETENAALETAAVIAVEIAESVSRYAALRSELDDLLRERSEQMLDRLLTIRRRQADYKETLGTVDGIKNRWRVAPEQTTRLDEVQADLRGKGMPDDVEKLATAGQIVPPLEFDWVFHQLMNAAVNKRELDARQRRRDAAA